MQILRVGKELARGFWKGSSSGREHAGDRDDDDLKQGENLRWGLVVGGEGMDEQFEMVANNPDVYAFVYYIFFYILTHIYQDYCNTRPPPPPCRRNESRSKIHPIRRIRRSRQTL